MEPNTTGEHGFTPKSVMPDLSRWTGTTVSSLEPNVTRTPTVSPTMSESSNRDREDAPLSKKLDELYDLLEGIEIAMFTTRRPDGRLVSRPMATQTQAQGTDLWFVTDIESNKLEELEFDPQVNLSYYRDRTREWVSVSGV